MHDLDKVQAIWWRFGKEHGEDDFRVNTPTTIVQHLDSKAARARKTSGHEWRKIYRVKAKLAIDRNTVPC